MDNQEEKDLEQKEEIINDDEEIEEEKDFDEQEVFTYTVDNNGINNDYSKDDERKSIIYVLGGFIILAIIIATIVVLVNNKSGKSESFSSIEKKMVEAAKEYYNNKKEELPKNENESASVTVEELIKNGYLKPIEEMKKGAHCTGNVNVFKNDDKYAYYPILNCGTEYKSSKLNEKIISDNLVTSKDGIYKIGNEYIFKGENPNNNVKFDGKTWKIIKINPDGSLKLLLISDKNDRAVWDDRYNNEIESYFGKNDFRLSRILEKTNEEYEKNTYVKSENKEILVKGNWCIGKISENDVPISSLNLCNDIYSDSYIGMINVKEILQPSLDDNCKNIYDLACTNYNYLSKIDTGWTLNASNETTYSVVSSDGGAISIDRASTYNTFVPVININSNVLYKSGNGTEKEPYTIGK